MRLRAPRDSQRHGYAMIARECRLRLASKLPIEDLYKYRLARFGQTLSHKLAMEIAQPTSTRKIRNATVEDLLSYLPMRYEDRSNPAHIQRSDRRYGGVAGTDRQDRRRFSGEESALAWAFESFHFRSYGHGSGKDRAADRCLVVCFRNACTRHHQLLQQAFHARRAVHYFWQMGLGQASRDFFFETEQTRR